MLTNWEPMKFSEDGGDMVIFAGLGDEFSISILDRLQFVDFAIWESSQSAVAVIELGQD